ncbi:hypothetical protein PFISCL1PPCAC_11869, partial [Pristionchus fissidentatus]
STNWQMGDSSDEDKKSSSGSKKGTAPPSRQGSQASIDSSCSSFEKIDPMDQQQEEADGQLFAATLPPIRLWGNAIVDTPDPDPRTVPIKADQEQYYTGESMRTALGNLVFFSILMFTAPFVSMYVSYHYLFLDYFHLSTADAMLDAGMIGVGTVFFIMAGFCWVAYKEECDAEKEKKAREAEERKREGADTAPIPVAADESKKDQ